MLTIEKIKATRIPCDQDMLYYSQAWRMHKADREGTLTMAVIQTIMSEEKANQKARLKIPMERIRKYFPQSYTAAQIEDAVVKLCERDYRRRTDRER